MCAQKMHADELEIDTPLVRRLLAAQFPRWAELPIRRVRSDGTDNAIFRLGNRMAVRLPRRASTAGQPAKERQWLPRLAPLLPLAIPTSLALGQPGAGYPWEWSVCTWLEGENAAADRIVDPSAAVVDLAQFVLALQRIDASDGPLAGAHNFFRGVPLAMRDAPTRSALASLRGRIDTGAATSAWEAALQTPAWDGPPVWLHGDLQAGNLLVNQGRLCGVIDFGCLGAGDPACELAVAWTLFSGASRAQFRTTLGIDAVTWARGRGWALSQALIALPYYWETNAVIVGNARRTIAEVLASYESGIVT